MIRKLLQKIASIPEIVTNSGGMERPFSMTYLTESVEYVMIVVQTVVKRHTKIRKGENFAEYGYENDISPYGTPVLHRQGG